MRPETLNPGVFLGHRDGTEFLKLYFLNFMFYCPCILVRLWVNDQLDAQLRYIIRLLLQSSTCFEQLRAHHQEVKLY